MIKDLVVSLTLGAGDDPAAAFAVSIAQAFGAHVAGIAFAFDPVITPTVMDGLSAVWIDTQRIENRSVAEAAIARFEAAAKREGVSAEHRIVELSLGGAANRFGHIARRFDLVVTGQTDPDRLNAEDLVIESALFESGRPLVVVPYIQKGPLKLDRIMVCWDGGRNAARAIGDALPFLKRGKAIEVVMVGDNRRADELPGADLGEHLARHGLKVEVKQLVADGIDIGNALLSYAADCGADFLVMGGYGHSRLREFVLGGTTRRILESMTVPILMAH